MKRTPALLSLRGVVVLGRAFVRTAFAGLRAGAFRFGGYGLSSSLSGGTGDVRVADFTILSAS
jgi:hypothetical protein